jgi:hypothetical protein
MPRGNLIPLLPLACPSPCKEDKLHQASAMQAESPASPRRCFFIARDNREIEKRTRAEKSGLLRQRNGCDIKLGLSPPLPSANTFGSIHYYEHHRFSYRGLSPHNLTPVPGVHKKINPTGAKRALFLSKPFSPAGYLYRYPR